MQTYYNDDIEWLTENFPLQIEGIKLFTEKITFTSGTFLINRCDSYLLKGCFTGKSKDIRSINSVEYTEHGNIINHLNGEGVDAVGNEYKFYGIIINHITSNSFEIDSEGYLFSAEIRIDKLVINYNRGENRVIQRRTEWFLNGKLDAHFAGPTVRSTMGRIRRTGENQEIDIPLNIPQSWSKDYIEVNTAELKCIISKVPKEYLPNQTGGLAIEYVYLKSDVIKPDMLKSFLGFLSFILGSRFAEVGYTDYDGETVLSRCFIGLGSDFLSTKLRYPMPPVKFNLKYEWGNLDWLIEKLFPTYNKLNEKYNLNSIIDKFFIARETPVGANLPILASAVESLASSYLKSMKIDGTKYLDENDYLIRIKEEVENITKKLSDIEGFEIIVNKIKRAYQKGITEKLDVFFKDLAIKIGPKEREALRLRNKMAHNAYSYVTIKQSYKDVHYSTIYKVLFFRIVLQLLNYNGYYIDYSLRGSPIKHISMPTYE